jgi:hypothetical protein
MMSLPAAAGAMAVSEIISSEAFGAITARETLLDVEVSGFADLDGEIARGGEIGGGYGRGALRDEVAGGSARGASNQKDRSWAGSGRGEIAAVHAQGEAVRGAGVDACGMQREDVCAGGDGYVCCGGLQRIIGTDGDDAERVWRGSGAGSGVDAVCVDCAARACERARGSLDLPYDRLIVCAEYRRGELLHR